MKKIYIIILILFSFTHFLFSQSTEGKQFWVGFMQNYIDSNRVELSIYLSAKDSTSGKIEIPYYKWSKNFHIEKDSTICISISNNIGMNSKSERKEKKGIFIIANEDINVFALNFKKHTSDATLIYPIEALGNDYLCFGYSDNSPTELLIVATEDNSIIFIDPSDITLNGRNSEFSIELNKGESYQVIIKGDVTGTHVYSYENNFALFSGSICSFVPKGVKACDHLYEQIPPTAAWGKKYGIIPLKTRKGDTYRIMAYKNNTNIYKNDKFLSNLNRGQYLEKIFTEACIISANKPIAIAQYSNGQEYDKVNSDPFMVMLTPIEQTRNRVTFNAFSSEIIENYYLNIMLRKKDLRRLTFDGVEIDKNKFKLFKADKGFIWTQLDISQGDHTIECGGDGFIGYVYGYGNYESYGYSVGTRVEKINEFKFRVGGWGQFNYYLENPSFLNFNSIPTCYRNLFEICDEDNFFLNDRYGYSLGLLVEVPSLLTTPFGLGVRAGLTYSPLTFSKYEYAFDETALERTLTNNASLSLISAQVFPYLIFTFIDELNLYVGANWTFNLLSFNNYIETISNSRITNEINNEVYHNDGDFWNFNYQVLGGVIGLGYEFVLNEDKSIRLSPEVFYFYNLRSSNEDFNFYMHKVTAGLSLKFGY